MSPSHPSKARMQSNILPPWICIAFLTLLVFSLGASEFIVIGIEQEIAAGFDVPLSRTSELIGLYSITYAICTPTLSLLSGRFSRPLLIRAYSLCYCASTALMAFAPTYGVLLFSRIILGAVSGALLALGVTYIPDLLPKRRVSMAISIVYAAASIAMVLITSLGKSAVQYLDWHEVMASALILAVLSSAAFNLSIPGEQKRGGSSSGVAQQISLLAEPAVISSIAIFIFGVGSVYVLYSFITPFLEEVLGLQASGASLVLMAYGIACFFSNIVSGILDARFGIKSLIASFALQAVLLFASSFLSPFPLWDVIVILAIGLTMYLVSVPCITVFMKTARSRHKQSLVLASSLEPMAFNIGIAFGSLLSGLIVDGAGLGPLGYFGSLLACVAAVLAAITSRLERRSVHVGTFDGDEAS